MSVENFKIWGESEDGKIRYQMLTKEYLESALDVIRVAFYPNENVCRAFGLHNDPEGIEEFMRLTRFFAKDGVTPIAVDKETNKVVSTVFNILKVKNPPQEENDIFENFLKSCKSAKTKDVLSYIMKVEDKVDFFELLKIDCILEIVQGATLPEYRGRKIAKRLREITVEIAKKLLEGINVKQQINDGPPLSLEPVPKAVTAVFTTFITQRIGRQLGFEVAYEHSYDDLPLEGAGDSTPKAHVMYKKLIS